MRRYLEGITNLSIFKYQIMPCTSFMKIKFDETNLVCGNRMKTADIYHIEGIILNIALNLRG